jgi:anti-sigma factor RsiW
MSTERTPKNDRDLWQSLALDRAVAPAAVSDLEFAAWLEGNLPETETARIDAAVATNPEMRLAAMELAEILGKPLPAAPDRMAVRAKALVGFETERRTSRSFGWLAGLLPSFDGGFGFQRGAMAGAAVMIAAVGFMMGGGLGQSYAHEKYASAEPTTITNPLGVDTTGQLNDLFTDSL